MFTVRDENISIQVLQQTGCISKIFLWGKNLTLVNLKKKEIQNLSVQPGSFLSLGQSHALHILGTNKYLPNL